MAIKKIPKFASYQIIIIVLLLIGISSHTTAQYIYLNSYLKDDEYPGQNAIFKIDLATAQIIDSLILPSVGSFAAGAPVTLTVGANRFLISGLTTGLPAKNSEPRDKVYSYYFLIDADDFNIIRQDSLINKMLGEIKKIYSDSISMEWIDESDRGWYESVYSVTQPFHRLNHVRDRIFTEKDFQSEHIGEYVGPHFICELDTNRYYWGYHDVGDSSYVNIIKVISDSTIIGELQIGERGTENIITGYSAQTGKIYSFITSYKLLSTYPLSQSPENINTEIIIINPENLSVETRIPLDMGEAYAAQETGTAESAGPYLYYYYFRQDGYGQFDPAYLLIFDTRTNEATWLRVGWR